MIHCIMIQSRYMEDRLITKAAQGFATTTALRRSALGERAKTPNTTAPTIALRFPLDSFGAHPPALGSLCVGGSRRCCCGRCRRCCCSCRLAPLRRVKNSRRLLAVSRRRPQAAQVRAPRTRLGERPRGLALGSGFLRLRLEFYRKRTWPASLSLQAWPASQPASHRTVHATRKYSNNSTCVLSKHVLVFSNMLFRVNKHFISKCSSRCAASLLNCPSCRSRFANHRSLPKRI